MFVLNSEATEELLFEIFKWHRVVQRVKDSGTNSTLSEPIVPDPK